MACKNVGTPPSNNTDSGTGMAGALGRKFREEILQQNTAAGIDFDWSNDQFYSFISSAVAEAFITDCQLGSVSHATEVFTGTGTQKIFFLANTPVDQSVHVFSAGLRITPADGITFLGNQILIVGATITFGTAPDLGADIVVDYVTTE